MVPIPEQLQAGDSDICREQTLSLPDCPDILSLPGLPYDSNTKKKLVCPPTPVFILAVWVCTQMTQANCYTICETVIGQLGHR